MGEFIEASTMFQNAFIWKMYVVLAVFFIGLAAIGYRSAVSKNDPIE